MDDDACVSGQGLLDMMHVLEQRVGKAVLAQAVATLAEPDKKKIAAATPLSWVPVRVAQEVNAAVARVTGDDVDTLSDAIVRAGVERSFKTVWRVFLSLTSDRALVTRAAGMYRRTRNKGEMSAKIDAPGTSESVLVGWPDANDRALRTIAVGIETVLRLSGRKDATTTWRRDGDRAVFTSTWTP